MDVSPTKKRGAAFEETKKVCVSKPNLELPKSSIVSKSVCSWVQSLGFLDGSGGFVVRFWLTNLGLEGFEVRVFWI